MQISSQKMSKRYVSMLKRSAMQYEKICENMVCRKNVKMYLKDMRIVYKKVNVHFKMYTE